VIFRQAKVSHAHRICIPSFHRGKAHFHEQEDLAYGERQSPRLTAVPAGLARNNPDRTETCILAKECGLRTLDKLHPVKIEHGRRVKPPPDLTIETFHRSRIPYGSLLADVHAIRHKCVRGISDRGSSSP
jgi:hypothetical protein